MKKILVVNVNWLGDVLFSIPALKAIKYGAKEKVYLGVMVPSRCRVLLENNSLVDEIIEFDERVSHRGFISKLKFIKFLKNKKFDKAIFFHRSFTRILICWLAGIFDREGYVREKSKILLTKTVPAESKNEYHKAWYLLNLVEKLGYNIKDKKYDFLISDSDLKEAGKLLLNNGINLDNLIVVLHPGANWEPKRWPADSYAQLIRLLIAEFNDTVSILITGTEKDKVLAYKIKSALSNKSFLDKVFDLTGETTLGILGGIFLHSDILISGDSGSLHMGCAVKSTSDDKEYSAPFCVGIFGPTDKNLTGPISGNFKIIQGEIKPECRIPCYNQKCDTYDCIDSISAGEVFQIVKQHANSYN